MNRLTNRNYMFGYLKKYVTEIFKYLWKDSIIGKDKIYIK